MSWYGLIVGIAIVVGWSVAEKIESKVTKYVPWVVGLGLIGARLYHIVDLWEYYSQNMSQIPMVWHGGMSIWGGIMGGLVGWIIVGADPAVLVAIVTGLPLAQAIGRLANGVNGEFTNLVLGVPWWGMEAILDLVLFGIVGKVKKEWRVGAYAVGYGIIRLVLQPYRR